MKSLLLFIAICFVVSSQSCNSKAPSAKINEQQLPEKFLVVLGIAQDAGYPQVGCEKECCKAYYKGRESKKYVTCLALVDRKAEIGRAHV